MVVQNLLTRLLRRETPHQNFDSSMYYRIEAVKVKVYSPIASTMIGLPNITEKPSNTHGKYGACDE